MSEVTIARQAIARRGRRLEYFTIVWNTLEGLIGVGAGLLAGSISLVGFGIDSFIEVTSGSEQTGGSVPHQSLNATVGSGEGCVWPNLGKQAG
jgi:hypothetical protein